MSDAKKYFEKAGGKKLIKQYWKAGVLHTALMEYATLGKSKTALEILRLSVQMKTQQKLERKTRKFFSAFDQKDFHQMEHKQNKTVWVLWWQGIEHAPLEAKVCWESVNKYMTDWNIVLLSEYNVFDYIQLPDFIIDKFKKGIVPFAHFADLIRLQLLITHGGLWMDSTILCTDSYVPKSILNSELFVYQPLKPGANGRALILSNWLIYAKTNNLILTATRDLLFDYWKINDTLIDYFIFHHFFSIACRHYPEEYQKIPPFCNSVPHILQLHFFQPFNQDLYDDWRRLSSFHKLTYKFSDEDKQLKGTFYDEVINHKNF